MEKASLGLFSSAALLLIAVAVLAAVQRNGPTIERPFPDMVQYMAIAEGDDLSSIPVPYRYRIWTPWLAALVPDPPESWLDQDRTLERQRLHFRFAVVNSIGLWLAALGVARLTAQLLSRPGLSWLGAGVFLTCYFPLTIGTLPMVEAWSWAFLAWALVFSLQERRWLVGLTVLLGLSCKETVLLAVPAALLVATDWRVRMRQATVLLIPVAFFLIWRFIVTDSGSAWFDAASTKAWLHDLFVRRDGPGRFVRAAVTFHVWWLPALAAWWTRRRDASVLIRWSYLVPAIFALPFLIPLVISRVWFFAFPFVIPLAVAGIRDRWPSIRRNIDQRDA